MKSIYQNSAKKYEDLLAIIIRDQDLGGIDFPLIAPAVVIDGLESFLPKEIAKKLNLESIDSNMPKEEEAK